MISRLLILCVVVVAMGQLDYESIDQDPFGKTLIDTLQLHISTSEPITKFIDMMREIENQIEEGQQDDDNKHQQFQELCNKDISDLEKEDNDLQLKITEVQSLIDEIEEMKNRKQAMVTAKTSWQEQLKNEVDDLVKLRTDENAVYQKKMEENEYVVFVITQVRQIFKDEPSPNAFTELQNHLNQASIESSNFVYNSNFANFFQVLGEIAQKADNYYADSILNVCEQLMKNIEDNISLDRKAEDRRQSIFDKQKQLYDKDLQMMEQELATIQADLFSIESRLKDAQNDINDSKVRREQKQKRYGDRQQECKEEAYNYQQNRSDNDKKRGLVSEVIGLFSANQREFKEYIAQRS